MYQRSAVHPAGLGQVARSLSVDFERHIPVILSLVHIGVGGAVYHDVYTVFLHIGAHRPVIRNIQGINVGEEEIGVCAVGHQSQGRAQLPVGACHQNILQCIFLCHKL